MIDRRLSAALLATFLFAAPGRASDQFDHVQAGRYQALIGDCAACHTAPGAAPFSGGVPLETPFGTLIPSNITPDRETGIGAWTFDEFRSALKHGVGRDGKRLYPAMPYPAYTKMTDEDVADLWSYLQRVEPVRNPVESNQLPFPFNIRLVLLGWNLLNFTPGDFKPDPLKSADWNRGAYVVNGPGHCVTCHTPKNILGADQTSEPLQGANLQSWVAPNLTSDPHKGIGSWSIQDITEYLKTGANRFDIASGPMAEAVENSTQHFTDADLLAVATYLKDVGNSDPAGAQPLKPDLPGMVAGQAIYVDRCATCHAGSGEGIPHLFPKLAKAPLVNGDDPTSLIRVVVEGSRAGATDARPTAPGMPALGWNFSDADIANVLTYIRNSWGNAAPAVTADEVKTLRAHLR
jgi:mono/diheme cytochrome c family protein